MAHNIAGLGVRTFDDLYRVVRSISRHFKTSTVFIIGSQSILLDKPDASVMMRTSGEIDAYPGNIREWEANHPGDLASEETNANFGFGSIFHKTFKFYIDGVDESTAKFPPGWEDRAVEKEVPVDEKMITVIAPCLDDLIVSKLLRLSSKDKDFIEDSQKMQKLDLNLLKERLESLNQNKEIISNAITFLNSLQE